MTPAKVIVWEYKSPEKTEVPACQPLPDGRVLVVECGTSRIIEVGRDGQIAKEIKLAVPPATVSLHDQYRGVRKTRDGHYLVSRKGEHHVEELDGDGRVLRSITASGVFLQVARGRTWVTPARASVTTARSEMEPLTISSRACGASFRL